METNQRPWNLTPAEVLLSMHTDKHSGPSAEMVLENQKRSGPNSVQKVRSRYWPHILGRQFKNPVIIVLLLAFGISIFLNEFLDGMAVLFIVVINILIGFMQEFKAEKSLQALAGFSAPTGRVLREGKIIMIPARDATLGDILIFEAGDYVIADARLIEAHQLTIDEALLTGESLPVNKHTEKIDHEVASADRLNMIFAGTSISRGTGRAVVTAIGFETEMGKIARMLESPISTETPLQKNLEAVSRKLLIVGCLIVIVIFILGYYQGKEIREIIMSALSLSIAVLPESLPTVVTIALVAAIMRLARKNVLMRRMDAVETLGEVDVICTDKTGTLTTGKMEVVEFHPKTNECREHLLLDMLVCNNASIENGGSGDPTEIALLVYALKSGKTAEGIKRKKEWSFDSQRKRMSVVTGGSSPWVYVKGAPESILSVCNLEEKDKALFLREAEKLSRNGMRTLAFAGKRSDQEVFLQSLEEAEKDLVYYGMIAIADPLREDARRAVEKCQFAGIRVVMMTGDHPQTATHIAQALGILKDGDDKVISGNDWGKYSAKELEDSFREVNVFARVSPEHKLSLVRSLKKQGFTIAMTGDGVNDGPALKEASVGIAMGKGGTEVARQASSLVLTDDNFSSIVSAVEEGRAVHGNIKRSIQFLLSQNLAELLFIGIAAAAGWPIPLNPMALLWINVVTDGVPALALAAEKIPVNFLSTSGKTGWKNFFDRDFQIELYSVGVLLTLLTIAVYLYGESLHGETLTARSYAFTFLIFAILFRSLSCRSEYFTFLEMRPNMGLLISIIVPICFQFLMQQSPYLLEIFDVRALSLQEITVLLVVSPIPVLLVELFKVIRRKKA